MYSWNESFCLERWARRVRRSRVCAEHDQWLFELHKKHVDVSSMSFRYLWFIQQKSEQLHGCDHQGRVQTEEDNDGDLGSEAVTNLPDWSSKQLISIRGPFWTSSTDLVIKTCNSQESRLCVRDNPSRWKCGVVQRQGNKINWNESASKAFADVVMNFWHSECAFSLRPDRRKRFFVFNNITGTAFG